MSSGDLTDKGTDSTVHHPAHASNPAHDEEKPSEVGSGENTLGWDWSKVEDARASKGDIIQLDQDNPGSTYQVGKRIGKGTYGVVYEGVKLSTREDVAIKFEPRNPDVPQLRDEYRNYMALTGCHGIPNVHYFGPYLLHNVLIMDQLGSNLEDLFIECGRRFTIKTVVTVGEQMISILKSLHEKGFIHRDVKPENFLSRGPSRAYPNEIFLVDLGMAKTYQDKCGKHIPYREHQPLAGTPRYMSINTHLGREQSRRDDLEAVAHILIYFLKGQLPWQGINSATKKKKISLICRKKQSTTVRDVCEGCPAEFETILQYVRDLGFKDLPDYDHLRRLLMGALNKSGEVDNGRDDWDEKGGGKKLTSSWEAEGISLSLRNMTSRMGTGVNRDTEQTTMITDKRGWQNPVTGQRQPSAPRDEPRTRKRQTKLLSPGQHPRPFKKPSHETLSTPAADNSRF